MLLEKLLDHLGNDFPKNKEEANIEKLVDLIQKIPGCEEASDGNVIKWMGPG